MITSWSQWVQRFSPLQSAMAAALVYGAWAYFVNTEHGFNTALKAGLVQASYAFLATAFVTLLARRIMESFDNSKRGQWIAIVTCYALMLVIPLSLHSLTVTPDILEAILPGQILSSIYIWLYCRQVT